MSEKVIFSPGKAVAPLIDWLNINCHAIFEVLSWLMDGALSAISQPILLLPPLLFIGLIGILSFFVAGIRVAVLSFICLGICYVFDLWQATVQTTALVVVAVLVSMVIGLPFGIALSRRANWDPFVRPVLDIMQTLPPWVYLVPAVMILGLGRVPALLATIIYGIPPVVRLTVLGMRQIQKERIELGRALGASDWLILRKIELPSAAPTLFLALNQCILLSLSLVVLAGLVGAGGLGSEVTRGLSRMDMGLGMRAGLAIVMLALVMDRITRGAARRAGPR